MLNIRDKVNDASDDNGYLFANEFNSLKNEMANVVKYRSELSNSTLEQNQLLKAIVAETKLFYYKDAGTINNVVLYREGEVEFKLADSAAFMFSPATTNGAAVKARINNGDSIPVLLNGEDLKSGTLKQGVVYMLVYNKVENVFDLKYMTEVNTNDLNEKSTFTELTTAELGSGLKNNDIVYIDIKSGEYRRALKHKEDNQTQNVVGVYKIVNGKHYVVFSGVVHDFLPNLRFGAKYYLSTEYAGEIALDSKSSIVVGRALKGGNFLVDINGRVSINVDGTTNEADVVVKVVEKEESKEESKEVVPEKVELKFDTVLYSNESKSGVTLLGDDIKDQMLAFTSKKYDSKLPYVTMYVKVNGVTMEINFASEYDGDAFAIVDGDKIYIGKFAKNDMYNNPVVLKEADDNVVVDYPETSRTKVEKTETTKEVKEEPKEEPKKEEPKEVKEEPKKKTYDTTITNGKSSDGVTLTDPSKSLLVSFDKVKFDETSPSAVMFASVKNTTFKLDFASEYDGSELAVTVGSDTYVGKFGENEDYSNPTKLD